MLKIEVLCFSDRSPLGSIFSVLLPGVYICTAEYWNLCTGCDSSCPYRPCGQVLSGVRGPGGQLLGPAGGGAESCGHHVTGRSQQGPMVHTYVHTYIHT